MKTYRISEWDAFVDYCDEQGLDPANEDFQEWSEEQRELAAESRMDRLTDWRI